MLVDTHFHLDLMDNMQDLIYELKRGADVGVFAVGTTPKAFRKEQNLCIGVDNIRVGLGLHPQLVSERTQEIDLFLNLIDNSRFIGEIGLDFNSTYLLSKEEQISCFRRIVNACNRKGEKILSVHSVRAVNTVIDVLKESGTFNSCIVILHWFTGTVSERNRAIDAGAYFSVNPKMLKTKSGKETIKAIPAEKILLETDAPFTKSYNNIKNLRTELVNVIKEISSLRGWDMSEQININSDRVWR